MEYFKNLFKGKSNARILQLEKDLSSLRQKSGKLVATYASRARDVFSELKALGESVKDDELAFNVLNGLRAKFETIRTILLASDQSLRQEVILPKLQQEENMKQLAGESQGEKKTDVAYAAKQKDFKKGSVSWKARFWELWTRVWKQGQSREPRCSAKGTGVHAHDQPG
jgi:hypothetical protein